MDLDRRSNDRGLAGLGRDPVSPNGSRADRAEIRYPVTDLGGSGTVTVSGRADLVAAFLALVERAE
jgi:hypothetical protein